MTDTTPPRAPLALLVLLQGAVSAASLVVEIVAGRMIAPYVGMSLYSWTAIIAVVLAGFSVGHWWGGRIAAAASERALRMTGWTMVAAALATAGATPLLRATAGPLLQGLEHPLAAIAALTGAVFFLPSLFAGVPAPVFAVVAMRGRDRSEQALGAMFAAGAVGAIAGTLLAGFLFVSWLGSVATLAVIAAVYALAAAICFGLGRANRVQGAAVGAALLAVGGVGGVGLAIDPICDRESSYFCIRTVTMAEDVPDGPVRMMAIDHLAHGISAKGDPRVMFTDHAAMLDALPRMRMGGRDFTSFHIGGGSYSVPRAWTDRGIGGITVAEIDPAVTEQAVADFWFDPAGVRILHRDARAALAGEATRYDVVVGDAFTDIAVPAHLVTAEFFALVASRLEPGGVFAMNLIDNTGRLDALAAMVETLRASFASVEVWTEATTPGPNQRRVFVLLASDGPSPVGMVAARSPDPKRFAALDAGFIDAIVVRKAPAPLTDDYAPIDRMLGLEPILD
ncbi:fused MFS/spermidine synthase [Rhodovulum sp. DZ06]|uniref:fused MFS/spermidine synthase n=1 Tax=Rhodovulum sp. DZ06 TaxID=3425126 RepID=UPI003D352520